MLASTEPQSQILYARDYQITGILFLETKRRAIIGDWPGIGKTLQASEAAINYLPALVVCPKYLTTQWYQFLSTQYPHLRIRLAQGTRPQRETQLAKPADFYIVNYHMLSIYKMPQTLSTIIFDEAHHLRNRTANFSRAASKLTRDPSRRVYMLTASLMHKSVDDVWHPLHILQPQVFTSYEKFVSAFCIRTETPYGYKILGIKKRMRKDLEELLSHVMLARTPKQVSRSLPPIIENTITVTMPPTLEKHYKQVKDHYRLTLDLSSQSSASIPLSAGAVLHTLRSIASFPGKLEAIKELLDDLDKPAVIFCWYRETAHQLHKILSLSSSSTILLTGDIEPIRRHKLASSAQHHIVATISSLSEGIDLSRYRVVIFAEEDWSPGGMHQALSRVVRERKQTNNDPVLVYYVHTAHTADVVIHRKSKSRETSIREVMKEVLT